MNASLALLIERAEWLYNEYGWISVGLMQRRLRVTKSAADYIMEELRHQRIIPAAS